MLKKYALEIYAPGSHGDDAVCHLESDQPFALLQCGDFINPKAWEPGSYEAAQVPRYHTPHGTLLRVTGIEHFIVSKNGGFTQHKIGVFTEAVDDVAKSRARSGMTLSMAERWILSNQFRVLQKLYPNEAKDFGQVQEAIDRGYELHYSEFSQHVYDETFSEAECREVLDILSMFDAVKHAYGKLSDKTGIDEHWTDFPGFDGNNESRQLGYCRFFCNLEGGRFTSLKRGDGFNSHAPLLPLMRKMVQEWNKSANPHELTREDLVRITNVKMT